MINSHLGLKLAFLLAASVVLTSCQTSKPADDGTPVPTVATSAAQPSSPSSVPSSAPLVSNAPPLAPEAQMALNTQLIGAATNNDSASVVALLADGAQLEFKGADGRTALVAATKSNAVAAARTLMEAGANVNAQDDLQDSAFLYAGAEALDEILLMTLAHGADVKSTNRYGGTALIPACEHGHVSTVKILLAAEVPVDHVNNLGWTGLLEAVILGTGGAAHQEVVRLLIEAGANVNLADSNGVTALAHAQATGQGAVAQLLLDAGAHGAP
ncbi:ankyrin repeat domain-containing protein [Arthrobacter sp. TWP1-1]|uniref:ankyrin repeat domain-containing protein n=1 Tax=Arthrobacter sp. TWP1-1 TaxID=2804568 RepID=UPI003CE8511A